MTQDEVLDEFRQAGALREGHFVLSSGLHSAVFLQKNLVFMHPDRCERLCRALADKITRTVGSEDRGVVTPGNTVMRVAGSGDFWWSEWQIDYPTGESYLVVDLIELRGGLVHRETMYWAAPFEAPAWRAPWVQRS